MSVGDDRVHHAVRGDRVFPRERLVDSPRLAVGLDDEVFRASDEAERRPLHRRSGSDLGRLAGGFRTWRCRSGKGRLVAEAAGTVDRAEQHLQQVDGTAGMEAVGMSRNTAHGVHRDRPTDHRVVLASGPVGPGLVNLDLLLECGVRQFGGDATNRIGRNADRRRDGVWRIAVVKIAPGVRRQEWRGSAHRPLRGRIRAGRSCRASPARYRAAGR